MLILASIASCGGNGALTASEPLVTVEVDPLPSKNPEFTSSVILISAPGKEVEILRLRPIATPNMTYLGAITVWPRDRDSITDADLGFPGEGQRTYHPAIGTVIPASETGFRFPGEDTSRPVWVNAGFRLASGTEGGVFDVEITYRVDGRERTERSRRMFLVCTNPCAGEDYDDGGDWADVLKEKLGLKELPVDEAP
ncbi:MAG: hypothetical protein ACT4QF_14215 [Sporichthyaceae bacterium]